MHSEMHWLRFSIIVLVAALLQVSLVQAFAITEANVAPSLLLALLVFCSIHCNSYDAVIASFSIGFAADIVGTSMGPHIIAYGIIGTVLADLNAVISMRRMPQQGVTIFLVGLISGAMVHVLSLLQGRQVLSALPRDLLWVPLYTAIVGPFLFLPLVWWMRVRAVRIKPF